MTVNKRLKYSLSEQTTAGGQGPGGTQGVGKSSQICPSSHPPLSTSHEGSQ